MKLLAIDTATEQCSVALLLDTHCITRCVRTPRAHAELILPMIQEVLMEAGIVMTQLDVIGFGRGPGAFTGVRIAIGVVQGLAFACDLPVVGVSDLAAVAQQLAPVEGEVLVCMDARMNEVYWGLFKYAADGLVVSSSIEQVTAPERVIQFVDEEQRMPAYVIGTGVDAYPVLREHFSQVHIHGDALPRAAEIAALAARDFYQGLAVTAAEAQPVYLRDQVTHVNPRT